MVMIEPKRLILRTSARPPRIRRRRAQAVFPLLRVVVAMVAGPRLSERAFMVPQLAALAAFFVGATAQAEEWSGRWKAVTTRCATGPMVSVKEEAGSVRIALHQPASNIATPERIIAIGSDGSGTLIYSHRALGDLELRIVAGKGKRQVMLRQQRGDLCRWEVN